MSSNSGERKVSMCVLGIYVWVCFVYVRLCLAMLDKTEGQAEPQISVAAGCR